MARLLAGRGIIFIDPLDARLHRLAAPVYRGALDAATELREALVARSKELETQRLSRASESHAAFRRCSSTRWTASERRFAATTAVSARARCRSRPKSCGPQLKRSPKRFSPNALPRPVLQDTLLPTAAYIGGPAEVAYMAQSNVVYKKILGRMPAILPRASFTIVEPRIARILERYGLELTDFLRGPKRAVQARAAISANRFARAIRTRRAWRGAPGDLRGTLEKLDPSLLESLRSPNEEILYPVLEVEEPGWPRREFSQRHSRSEGAPASRFSLSQITLSRSARSRCFRSSPPTAPRSSTNWLVSAGPHLHRSTHPSTTSCFCSSRSYRRVRLALADSLCPCPVLESVEIHHLQ